MKLYAIRVTATKTPASPSSRAAHCWWLFTAAQVVKGPPGVVLSRLVVEYQRTAKVEVEELARLPGILTPAAAEVLVREMRGG